MDLGDRLGALLVGHAIGDAIGLPREGLTPRRALRRFGPDPRHALVLGRGLVSDDTEHAFMTAQALLASGGDVRRFEQSLAWRLRGWIAALPCGVGWATLRACVRLWLGLRSGVASAGNGPLMRASIIGAAIEDRAHRTAIVAASTRLTHTDPLALEASLAIAEAAAAARTGVVERDALLAAARSPLRDERWSAPLARLERALDDRATPAAWAAAEGLDRGVTGYVLHTLPAVLLSWLRSPLDYAAVLTAVLELGGDTDTVGAIAGGLAGLSGGPDRIPPALRAGMIEWPLTLAHLDGAGRRLARTTQGLRVGPEPLPARVFAPLRNLAFTTIVIAHLVRRLLPPY